MWRRGAARADGRASDISVLQIRRAWRRPFRQPAIAGSNPGQADTILTSGACGTPDRHTGSLAWTHAKRPCPVPQHLLGCGRRQTLLRMQYGSIVARVRRFHHLTIGTQTTLSPGFHCTQALVGPPRCSCSPLVVRPTLRGPSLSACVCPNKQLGDNCRGWMFRMPSVHPRPLIMNGSVLAHSGQI